MGLVADVFSAEALAKLPGRLAIGQVRYSTAGVSQLKNAQPFMVQYAGGGLAIAHNGNLVNADQLREDLGNRGAIFQSHSDTEATIHLIPHSRATTPAAQIGDALRQAPTPSALLSPTP